MRNAGTSLSYSGTWLRNTLPWLLLVTALLLPASAIMEHLWDGRDIEWMGAQLVAAGPKSERLRDFSALLGQLSRIALGAGSVLWVLTLLPCISAVRRYAGRIVTKIIVLGNGEPDRIRTCDPLIKSQLLYQLSYGPTLPTGRERAHHRAEMGFGQP